MAKELPGQNHPEDPTQTQSEVDWQNYSPYRWFMDTIGGPDKMIPKNDGLSWMLRVHHREITESVNADHEMSEQTSSIVSGIDDFYEFREGNQQTYASGNEPTKDANPAQYFFIKTAFGPMEIGNFTRLIDAQIHAVDEAAKLQPEALALLDQYGGSQGLRKALGREYAQMYVVEEAKVKFLGKKPLE